MGRKRGWEVVRGKGAEEVGGEKNRENAEEMGKKKNRERAEEVGGKDEEKWGHLVI